MAGETYPEDSVQSLVREWWARDESGTVARGRLLKAFVPYPEHKPLALVPEGRADATDHTRAIVRVVPFHMDRPTRGGVLPVAGMPLHPGEAYYAVRGKVRPVVVLSEGGDDVPAALRRGQASWQSARTFLVAPYYGGEADGERAGWNPAFVERIRRAEYPQYVWDRLPTAASESILRLDNILPIGADPAAYKLADYRLTGEALELLDEWLAWLFSGELPGDGVLAEIRSGLAAL